LLTQIKRNALKFSKKDAVVELSISSSDTLVHISVKDNGIGIPANKLDEIFDPFHQLDSSSTRKAGGVGLGLALAKKIVDAHGSTLKVNSQLDVGSTFDFSLRKLIK